MEVEVAGGVCEVALGFPVDAAARRARDDSRGGAERIRSRGCSEKGRGDRRRVFDDGVLEPEKVSSECRLERLRLEYEEVEGGRFTNKAWISSILASFSCL